MTTTLTREELKEVMPPALRRNVTQEVANRLNQLLSGDPEVCERYRENVIGYTHVLKQGKFKMTGYLDAVRYVTYKMMNLTNADAYSRTFPDKMVKFAADGVDAKTISTYVHGYHHSKLVTLVMDQVLVPAHIVNADIFQEAINHQVHLMRTAQSEKVQQEAANSLMTHLKRPETAKMELEVTHKDDAAVASLKEETRRLAEQQKQWIESGKATAQDVAHSKIVQGETIEDGEVVDE